MGRMGLAVLLVVLIAAGAAATAGGAAVEPGWVKAAQRLDMPVNESPNSDNQPGLFLTWYTEKRAQRNRGAGVEMWVEIDGRDKPRALRIARSMRVVPD